MPVCATLFDLDGTLIDSYALLIASFRHACREVLGREITDQDAQIRWGQPLAIRFAAVAPERMPQLVDVYAAYYDRHERALASVYPGIPEMLDALTRRGCAIAVVTSKRARAAVQAIRTLDLAHWIAITVGAEDALAPKPAPDPVLEALTRLGASPASALMIGDASLDILAARAAGVRSVAALWGARDPEALMACEPDYVARVPRDVEPIVASA